MKVIGLLLAFDLAGFAQNSLPDGPGKEVALRVCTSCHGAGSFTRGHRDRERWQRIVDDMKFRGAKGTDADFKTIVDYLASNFGVVESAVMEVVNVNRAAAWRIARALKLDPGEGDAIVDYREEHGDFRSLDELAKVVDRAKVESVKDRILFQDRP